MNVLDDLLIGSHRAFGIGVGIKLEWIADFFIIFFGISSFKLTVTEKKPPKKPSAAQTRNTFTNWNALIDWLIGPLIVKKKLFTADKRFKYRHNYFTFDGTKEKI